MRGVNLSRLLRTGEFSDLTINASGVVYKVHRCVVFPQCEAWKNMPEVDGQLVLKGPKVTQAILDFMYSGTYVPIDIRCRLTEPLRTASDSGQTGEPSVVANVPHDPLNTHDSDKLSYSDHSMLLSASVMIKAREYNLKELESQAKDALIAVAPSLTEHAEFIPTIKHILDHYQDHEGLEIVLQMIKPGFCKSAGMRRRLQAVMRSYPHLAVELLEPLMTELNRWEEAGKALIARGQQKRTDKRVGVPSPEVPGRPSASVQPGASSALANSTPQDGPGILRKLAKKGKRPKNRQNAGVSYSPALSAAPTGDAAALASTLPLPQPAVTAPKKRKNEEQSPELEKRNRHTVDQDAPATEGDSGEGSSRP